MFTSCFLRFCYYDLHLSHACWVMFSRAPVVYSGLFASLWFYLSKRIPLGSITLCHHHHWCCCWDISLCLNPSCVIKVPLCISSPSLSENLSCPLMGVCWWVSLIVGLWFAMSFVPAVTLLPIVWCSAAPLHKKPVIFSFPHSDRLCVGRGHFFLRPVAQEKLPFFFFFFFSATRFLNPPHSFLLQASSPPASGLIVRVYYLTVYSLTPPPPTKVCRLQGVAT